MTDIHIHQIFYDEKTRRELEPGFLPLDNSANERPDWREYWPMRNFLMRNTLVEDDFYGFLSSRFEAKTGSSFQQIKEFLDDATKRGVDAAIFSPMWDLHALFWNVFEQGDYFHPGLLRAGQEFFNAIGKNVAVTELVTDSRNSIFSNYFAAKPRFWRKWLEINEQLFRIAEGPPTPLRGLLRTSANWRPGEQVEMKVFIMERLASFLLATSSDLSCRSYKVRLPMSNTAFGRFAFEAIVCDALKIAFVEQRDAMYKTAFDRIQQQVKEQIG